MAENLSEEGQQLARLSSPARNNYFAGKLLTEYHFKLEQNYFNRKRWLLNRLGFGTGVLCGLEVTVSQDGQCVLVKPGVAIDPLGREIVVPEAYCVQNPRQPTDCQGKPKGDPIQGAGVVHLGLAYHACLVEPVPVLVSSCDTQDGCAANVIRERFVVSVCAVDPAPDGLPEGACEKIFPSQKDDTFDRRQAACQVLGGDCPEPDSECVVLGRITLPEDPQAALVIDECVHRRVIYSNVELFELILCLADRVDQCCQADRLLLQYVSGDAQSAPAGQGLKDPLVVRVVDSANNAIANEAVTFKVRGGGGAVVQGGGPVQVVTFNSDAAGKAQVMFQVGPNAGLNTVEASINDGAQVVFTALGVQTAKAPVITAAWPENRKNLNTAEVTRLMKTGLELSFDQVMDGGTLSKPDNWLGVWLFYRKGDAAAGTTVALRAILTLAAPAQDSDKASYILSLPNGGTPQDLIKRWRIGLLAANASGVSIIATQSKLLLDADFAGTGLDFTKTGLSQKDPALSLLDALNKMGPGTQAPFTADVYNNLANANPPGLPSGDGTPGGLYHSYFGLG